MPKLDRTLLFKAQGTDETSIGHSPPTLLVRRFGWLAPWWVRSEIVSQAANRQPGYRRFTQRPHLPTCLGGCWAIFVANNPPNWLRSALLLPLCWREQAGDDPCLPPALICLARQVREQFPDERGDEWSLHLAHPQGEEHCNLSDLDESVLGASSAWASLAGGLLLARDGLYPKDRVWASVAWNDQVGIGPVDGLSAKLDIAEEWQCEHVFVPIQNQPDVTNWRSRKARQLHTSYLVPSDRSDKPLSLLSSYLATLGKEPAPEQPIDIQVNYYQKLAREDAKQFYWRRLLSEVVASSRTSIPTACQPTHLVTVVSKEDNIVALTPLALKVQHCLLLYDGQSRDIAGVRDRVMDKLNGQGIQCQSVALALGDRERECKTIADAVTEFSRDVLREQLALDMTPGFKPLTLALVEAAPPGAWLVYCRHEQLPPDGRVKPGTERYDCWQH